jgi:hypothetical protein
MPGDLTFGILSLREFSLKMETVHSSESLVTLYQTHTLQ